MLLLRIIPLVILVAVLVQYASGNQRIVHVSELISDDEDFITSGEDDNRHICYVYGNCPCSLDQALANLTSNVLINITTNVTLSSLIKVSDIEKVTIIGHNNPTVNCKDFGRIHLNFCNNCIIQGITWDGRGSVDIDDHTEPVLKLSNSSNITIDNCSFQYSKGQAVLLSEVSGDVNIDHCNFVHNNHYRGHGAAIHYSSSNVTNCHQLSVFTISDCNFAYNYVKSLVYIKNTISRHNITIHCTKFCHNQGIFVYAVSQNIYLTGKNAFQNNTAKDGTVIYISDHSTIIFSENSDVTFTQNFAKDRGGTVFLRNHSNVIFDQNSVTVFNDNIATYYGGAIYSEVSSNITFKANCKVTFSNNSAKQWWRDSGGAMYSTDNSFITFEGNSSTEFSNNSAGDGEAIYSDRYILFQGNSSTRFSNNIAQYGGAIFSDSYILFEGNSCTIFSNNIADLDGGAIFSLRYILFEGNSSTEFSNNIAGDNGGAIAIDYTLRTNISFEGFSTVVFRNNIAEYGGAMFARDDIIFSDNSAVTFTSNKATFGETVFSSNDPKIKAIGNSTVTFNDLSAKWCNNTCLPYTGQGDVVTIDSNGIVWCSDQKSFICLSMKCYCNNLECLLGGLKNNTLVNITDTVTLSTVIELEYLSNISIIGYNNITVICVDGGGLKLDMCSDLTIEGITWIGCGKYDAINNIPVIYIRSSSKTTIQNCAFQHSLGIAISLFYYIHNSSGVNINHCNFMNNNNYNHHGTAIYCTMDADEVNINISNCNFSYNGNAKSMMYFQTVYDLFLNLNTSIFHNNQGVSVYLSKNITLHVSGDVLFKNNVAENGAGIYICDHSTVSFDKSSNVKLVNNSAYHNGAAIFVGHHSNVIFEQSSVVTFNDNKASNGTVYCESSSNVTFKANCNVTFSSNSVTQYGAAIYSFDNSHVTFTGNSKVTFINNIVSSNDTDLQHGGTIYSENNGYISFEGNSFTVFTNNIADYGAAIFSFSNSNITFKDSSRVTFNNNIVQYCGVLTSVLFSSIVHKDNTEVTYDNNVVSCIVEISTAASAMCNFQRSNVIFSGQSLVTYTNNTADGGGAIAVFSNSDVVIEEYSIVTFNNNIVQYSSGGALTCYNNSIVTIKGNSNVTFKSNKASQDGGAIYSYNMCKIIFKDNSTSTYINNTARNNGGAILSSQTSEITFEVNSQVVFNFNTADNGGAFYFSNSNIKIKGTSKVSFYNNIARQDGGAGYLNSYSIFILEENCKVSFDNNKAFNGGAMCINMMTEFVFKGNSTSLFHNNLADEGGGAVKVLNNSSFTLKDYISIKFTNNFAQYGGAIFLDKTAVMVNNSSENYINFKNNFARILGNSVYHDVAEMSNSSCLYNKITGVSDTLIGTPPNELKFDDPAICIDDDNDTQCKTYYVQNIMLGREIAIPVCVLDYYNQSADSIYFLLHETHPYNSYSIKGGKNVSISCDMFEGISIIGNETLSKPTNFSITITLNTALYPDWKQISVNLIIELSPYACHPGFWQYPNSTGCECYNAGDIVLCSGSSSIIKRGYWFGGVTGKPTVIFCPINYCNFTCCETSNGYYHLSPVRDNQCRSHRSGTACGSCEEGYTLSFDSPECVNVDSCTAGQTILVILLTMIYWIVTVTLVFAMMYYKVGIGYLYSITYYYSILDILLCQNLQASRRLYLTVSIISSFSKITPQFLGELCLTTGMSGIDQQLIHYIHPSAVIMILVIITFLARTYRRISAIISRGIIHVICLLLLLSYTSIASTSLLLMRSLTFHRIDKVYTFLSPDIEYFHGRHLAYGIVALLCTITIVLGLPLLLTLEPFLNHKINFIKIKPLLDQFQGCYKDKYRCFAGYYMICRLVIVSTVIANLTNEFVANYLLTIVCGIIDLIHVTVKPYNKEILNKFDSIILHLIIFVAALTLLDDIDSPSVMTTVYALVLLPLLIFFGMIFFLHKDNLKKIIKYFTFKHESPNSSHDVNEVPMREFDLIVDDSMRINATICDIK